MKGFEDHLDWNWEPEREAVFRDNIKVFSTENRELFEHPSSPQKGEREREREREKRKRERELGRK